MLAMGREDHDASAWVLFDLAEYRDHFRPKRPVHGIKFGTAYKLHVGDTLRDVQA